MLPAFPIPKKKFSLRESISNLSGFGVRPTLFL